jgi:serine protease Do
LARQAGAIVLPAALCVVFAGQAALAERAPESFADLAEKLLPSVVNISTSQTVRGDRNRGPGFQVPPGSPFEEFFKEFFDRQREQNRPRRATSLGSGFVLDAEGYIVTNNHVISEADEINVILHDNTTLQAEIVGRDPKTDLALLKVESDQPLVGLQWGDSDAMRVGDWVLAIGNPFGLGGTVTAGIVSARERDINAGPYDDFLQTDASINRGNSGGPMFDLDGEVIGINTAIFSPSGGSVGIGFAIPSNLARPVIEQLRKYGRTRRGWLGVRIQMVTDEIAESLGLGEPRGALVASVTKEGPSEKAKIQPGDVILTFDGRPVTEMRELPRMVAETEIGKEVDVTVWRDESEHSLHVTLGELEEAEAAALTETESGAPETDTFDDLGLVLSDVTTELREQFELGEDVSGVVITDVAEDSPAGQKGLRPGDVIVEVGQEEVASPSDVAGRIKDAKDSGRKSVLMLVDRQGDLRFVAIRIDAG